MLNTGQTAACKADGSFDLTNLSLGAYALTAMAPGCRPQRVQIRLAPHRDRAVISADLAPADVGVLWGKVVQARGERPRPARISVRDAQGQYVVATDAAARPFSWSPLARPRLGPPAAEWFWSLGEFAVALPPGEAAVCAYSGYEFHVAQTTAQIKSGEVTELTIRLERPFSMERAGGLIGTSPGREAGPEQRWAWTCGDALFRVVCDECPRRATVNLPLAAAAARAEGLEWMFFPGEASNDGVAVKRERLCREQTRPGFSCWPGRITSAPWGGTVAMLGPAGKLARQLEQPLHEALAAAEQAGGLAVHVRDASVSDEQTSAVWPWGPELAFDLVAGPGMVKALALECTSAEPSPAERTWYTLLDHGYRIAPVYFAPSCLSCGLPPVSGRTYARVTTWPPTPDAVAAAIRRGQTFVTSGPVIALSVAEPFAAGQEAQVSFPGDILPCDDRFRQVKFRAWQLAFPEDGIDEVQIVRNGEIVRRYQADPEHKKEYRGSFAVREREAAWYVVRVVSSRRDADGAAHVAWTSPLYFRPPGSPALRPLTSQISGRVTSGARPISGATIEALLAGKVLATARTDAHGRYALTAPLRCAIRVKHPQYAQRRTPMTPDGAPRLHDTLKYIAWDAPAVNRRLHNATPEDLANQHWQEDFRQALRAVSLDFELERRG